MLMVFIFSCKDCIFNSFLGNSKLQKTKKLSVEARYPLPFILKEHCNCIISCTRDCDLNYVAIECFYLGVPYIHNSPILRDYGYYYPEYNVSKGAQQIKFVIENHNREEYIEKHKPIVEKFSVKNPLFITWARNRLKNRINYDCEFTI